MLNLSNIPVVTEVAADMSVHGKIEVKSDAMNFSSGAIQNRSIEDEKIQTATDFRRKLFNKNTGDKNDFDKNSMVVANAALAGGMVSEDLKTAKKGDGKGFNEGIIMNTLPR